MQVIQLLVNQLSTTDALFAVVEILVCNRNDRNELHAIFCWY